MVKMVVVSAVLLLLCDSSIVYADSEWRLRKDEHNIQVYTRKLGGSRFDAV